MTPSLTYVWESWCSQRPKHIEVIIFAPIRNILDQMTSFAHLDTLEARSLVIVRTGQTPETILTLRLTAMSAFVCITEKSKCFG